MAISDLKTKIRAGLPKLKNGAKHLAGKPLYVGSKIVGASCLVGVLYDAHVNGKECAVVTDREDTAQRLYGQYDQYLTSNKESGVIAKLKKAWFNSQQAYPFHHANSNFKGYLKGFGKTIFRDLPIVALSAIALAGKNADKSILNSGNKLKGLGTLALSVASKVSGILLTGIAAKEVSNDVLGLGQQRKRL